MSDPVYTYKAAFSAKVVHVTSNEGLSSIIRSLSNGDGGTILLDAAGGPYHIEATNLASDGGPVLIAPADPGNPPLVEQVTAINAANLTVTGMRIESGEHGDARGSWLSDVYIAKSSNIEISGNWMSGDGVEMITETNGAERGETAIIARDSSNIAINGNTIENYGAGVVYLELKGLTISDNDISGIQSDGLRGGGIQDVVISGNHLHDFHGTTQAVNHSDMIQIWGSGTNLLTKNVEISGNILDSSGEAASQGIFIKNETFGSQGYYQDISIFGNLVHNGMVNGIAVAHTDGVKVYDNTVLWDRASSYQSNETSEPDSAIPRIRLDTVRDASVTGNVTSMVLRDYKVVDNGANYIVSFNDPAAENYIGNHIVNGGALDDVTADDLRFVPDSPLYGTFGAPLSSASFEGDKAVVTMSDLPGHPRGVAVSAVHSVVDGTSIDLDAVTVRWTADDGTVKTGQDAWFIFDTPGYHDISLELVQDGAVVAGTTRIMEAGSELLFETDFSDGGRDQSEWDAKVKVVVRGDDGFTDGLDGEGFRLDADNYFRLDRGEAHLFGNDTFQIDMAFRPDAGMTKGHIMSAPGHFSVSMTDDGKLRFAINTNEDKFEIFTDAEALSGGEWNDLSILYDGPAGILKIDIDGETAALGEGSGTIPAGGTFDVYLGYPWAPNAQGVVDDLRLSAPVSSIYGDMNNDTSSPGPIVDLIEEDEIILVETPDSPSEPSEPDIPVEDPAVEPVETPVETPAPPPAEPPAPVIDTPVIQEPVVEEPVPAPVPEPTDAEAAIMETLMSSLRGMFSGSTGGSAAGTTSLLTGFATAAPNPTPEEEADFIFLNAPLEENYYDIAL